MNLGWEPGNNKQSNYFAFAIKTRDRSVSYDIGKINQKELPNLFLCNTNYSVVKCCWNVNFEEIDTEFSTGKMVDFDYSEKYLRSIYIKYNIVMTLIRKANSHSVDICRFGKNQDQGETLIQTLIFLKLSSAHEHLRKRNVMQCIL